MHHRLRRSQPVKPAYSTSDITLKRPLDISDYALLVINESSVWEQLCVSYWVLSIGFYHMMGKYTYKLAQFDYDIDPLSILLMLL